MEGNTLGCDGEVLEGGSRHVAPIYYFCIFLASIRPPCKGVSPLKLYCSGFFTVISIIMCRCWLKQSPRKISTSLSFVNQCTGQCDTYAGVCNTRGETNEVLTSVRSLIKI